VTVEALVGLQRVLRALLLLARVVARKPALELRPHVEALGHVVHGLGEREVLLTFGEPGHDPHAGPDPEEGVIVVDVPELAAGQELVVRRNVEVGRGCRHGMGGDPRGIRGSGRDEPAVGVGRLPVLAVEDVLVHLLQQHGLGGGHHTPSTAGQATKPQPVCVQCAGT
jgi:hypothetical protein